METHLIRVLVDEILLQNSVTELKTRLVRRLG